MALSAVSPATGTPAACSNVRLAGFGASSSSPADAYSAKAPWQPPYTSSPGRNRVTLWPTASTTPATSTPRTLIRGRCYIGSLATDIPMARIAVHPERGVVLDFEARFPSALSARRLRVCQGDVQPPWRTPQQRRAVLSLRLSRESKECDLEPRSRSEEHTSELQSHSFISYAVFCLKKKTQHTSLTLVQDAAISCDAMPHAMLR